MKHYRDENWADILIPKGNSLINLSTGEEEKMQPITKTYDCELKDFNNNERTFTAIASTESVDRDGDILRANGWNLKNFKKNPRVLWAHDDKDLPIAKATDIRIHDKKLLFKPKFATAEMNPKAEQIFQMFKAGFLRAFSVRFDPVEWEDIKQDDGKQSSLFRQPRDYKSLELLEISAVNIPANAEALKSAAMHDFVVKSYISDNMKLFPTQDATKIWTGVDVKTHTTTENIKSFDFTEDLKDKHDKIDELKRKKELKIAEMKLDAEIKSLEQEFEDERVKEILANEIKALQNGITALVKK